MAVVYPFGAVEGLLLDSASPSWRNRYFVDKFDLGKYSIPGYPHKYLVGRDGRVALDRHGAISEEELEREIKEALSRADG